MTLKALLVMAESLYHQSEFEQALVCYHRAKRLKTTVPEVDRGIFKCEEAINNAIGGTVFLSEMSAHFLAMA